MNNEVVELLKAYQNLLGELREIRQELVEVRERVAKLEAKLDKKNSGIEIISLVFRVIWTAILIIGVMILKGGIR